MTAVDETLTEARYDEIVEQLLPYCTFSDTAAMMLRLGKPEWQQKWDQSFREHNFLDSPKPKIRK
jgi:hypothetical protein